MFDHIQHPTIIPMEDDLVYTDHDPFCSDPICPCHEEDSEAIESVVQHVRYGLMTPAEATRFTQDRQL